MDIREIKSSPEKNDFPNFLQWTIYTQYLKPPNSLLPLPAQVYFGESLYVPLSSIKCLHILTLLYSTGASTSMSPQKNGYKCFSASLKWLFTASSSRSFAKSILGNQGMPALVYLGMWRYTLRYFNRLLKMAPIVRWFTYI